MLGPEEEGKISHVVELEISERSKEVKEFPPEEEGKKVKEREEAPFTEASAKRAQELVQFKVIKSQTFVGKEQAAENVSVLRGAYSLNWFGSNT
jgi:hypothetical protein